MTRPLRGACHLSAAAGHATAQPAASPPPPAHRLHPRPKRAATSAPRVAAVQGAAPPPRGLPHPAPRAQAAAAQALGAQHADVNNAGGRAPGSRPLRLPALPVKVSAAGLLWTPRGALPPRQQSVAALPAGARVSNCQAREAAGRLTGGTGGRKGLGIRWAEGEERVTRWKSPQIGSNKPDPCR